ncbi:hypothetical protein Tco_1413476 [Tanacetum coccineum]
MKYVQSMSLSMTPVKRYGNPESGYESYMPAAHSELSNSIPLNVPKPLEKLKPPDSTVVQSHSETVYPRSICQLSEITESVCPNHPRSQHKYPECLGAAVELSPTSFLDVGVVRHNLLRGGNSASGVSSPWSTSGGMDGEAGSGGSEDDGNSNDVGTSGGKCSDDGGGGSGGEGI